MQENRGKHKKKIPSFTHGWPGRRQSDQVFVDGQPPLPTARRQPSGKGAVTVPPSDVDVASLPTAASGHRPSCADGLPRGRRERTLCRPLFRRWVFADGQRGRPSAKPSPMVKVANPVVQPN